MLISLICIMWFARTASQSLKRNDITAVQASHTIPTPRVGGLALVLALFVSGSISHNVGGWGMYSVLLASGLPVFITGLAEDLGFFASPRRRLVAAGISGVLFMAILGEWLSRTGVPGFDIALQWSPLAIAFSLFLAVGISHAFNLIDGLNGLAGFTALAASLALATIAQQANLIEHRDILLIIAAALIGFLVFNFPFGKIFLGDAGAYVVGHLLVWTSISILWHAPSVTPFAMLLIFFWPIADTLLAISRRLSLGRPIAQPDRLHFHQMVMRGVEIIFIGRKKRRIANPIAAMFTLPFIFAPMLAGVFLSIDRSSAAIACAAFTAIFIVTYKIGIRLAPKLRRSVR